MVDEILTRAQFSDLVPPKGRKANFIQRLLNRFWASSKACMHDRNWESYRYFKQEDAYRYFHCCDCGLVVNERVPHVYFERDREWAATLSCKDGLLRMFPHTKDNHHSKDLAGLV